MLQEPAFLILTAVAETPRHGYAIVAAVIDLSEGRLNLRPGTLYAALDRFLEAGLVTVQSEEVVDGRARRTYAITNLGLATLAEEIERMERNAALGRRFLQRPDSTVLSLRQAIHRTIDSRTELGVPGPTGTPRPLA